MRAEAINKVIGVVSGLGPSAGLDLAQKVIDQTVSRCDQDHLPMMMVSIPELVGNRTDFILGADTVNPARGIIYALDKLFLSGANVVGIPCNTSHADVIFHRVREHVDRQPRPVVLINMIDEVCRHILDYYPDATAVGVLSTSGTAAAGVYREALQAAGLSAVELPAGLQGALNEAIHSEVYGIKAQSNPVSGRAVGVLERCIDQLQEQGAELAVLGCTELPLAAKYISKTGLVLIDSGLVLARALVREAAPEKLRAWPVSTSRETGAVVAHGRPATQDRPEVATDVQENLS